MTTASRSSSANSSSAVASSRASVPRASSRRRSGSRSATAAISQAPLARKPSAWRWPGQPPPTMPTLSFAFDHVRSLPRRAQTGEASSVRLRKFSALITAVLADPIAIARQARAFRDDPIAQGEAHEQGADRLPLLLVRSRDAGGRQTDVDADRRTDADRHRLRRLCGHHRTLGHAEQLVLHGRLVRHHAAAIDVAAARQRADPRAHQAAGQRFGDRERQAARAQQVEHHRFHGLVVDPEHEVAEDRPQAGFLLRQDRIGHGLVGGLGGDPHLDALDAARQKGDRRIAQKVELEDPVGQHLGEARFGLAPGAQHAAGDHGADAGAPLQVRQHGAAQHLLHLVRHARHGVDHLGADRADQARCRARHLRDRPGAFRHVRLAQVVLGHVAAARGEQGADALGDLGVADQAHAHHRGNRLARDVVLGRAQAAAQDHRVGALERQADAVDDPLQVVADLGLEMRIDAGQAPAGRRSRTSSYRRSDRAAARCRWPPPRSA